MKKISALDRLIHKPVTLTISDENTLDAVKAGDFLIYTDEEGKEHLAEYLGYLVNNAKQQTFKMRLDEIGQKNFDYYQKDAERLFIEFSKQFKSEFPDAVTICARSNIDGTHIYFYFFAEERYNFADFVRRFRDVVKKKFFIYQVSARDRVRLHPDRDTRFDASGLPLMYSIFRHPLPMVESDVIHAQNLDGRDPERLKDRSGKYNHTLGFEREFYEQESKRYPQRGSIVQYDGAKTKCVGSNILTQEIKLRGLSDGGDNFAGEWIVISLDEYEKKCKKPIENNPSSPHLQE